MTVRLTLSQGAAEVVGDDPCGVVWVTRAGGGLWSWPLTEGDRRKIREALTVALTSAKAA